MSNPTIVTVNIPGPSASKSKMEKKGWKCWAKVLSSVATPANDGYAYAGDFVSVGQVAELSLGSVLLHCDQSSATGVGVVLRNSAGKPFVAWAAETSAAKWAGTLAAEARKLLAMQNDDRLRYMAKQILARERGPGEELKPEVAEYWRRLAGESTPQEAATDLVSEAVTKITAILAALTDDQRAAALASLTESAT